MQLGLDYSYGRKMELEHYDGIYFMHAIGIKCDLFLDMPYNPDILWN